MVIRIILAVLLMSSSVLAGRLQVKSDKKTPVKIEATRAEQLRVSPPASEEADSKDAAVHWQVLSNGGGITTVGSYTLGSTIGQTASGYSTLGSHTLHSGFWQDWSDANNCCAIRGDVNHSGDPIPDITDVIYLVQYMFLSGPEPVCPMEADADGDGEIINVSDLVYLVSYMFLGGPAPVPCP